MKKALLSFATTLFAAAVALAANSYFIGTCDKNALEYKCGEEIKFSLNYVDGNGKVVDGQKLQWKCTGDDGAVSDGVAVSTKNPLVIKTSLSKPGYVHVVVTPVDENGKKIKNADKYEGGACACFDKIVETTPEPNDFDNFWAKQLAALKKIPMNVKKTSVAENNKPNYDVFELTLDCLGKPAKAYLTIPKNAAPKSLPLKVSVHGYGVSRISIPYSPNAIALSIARHSYKLGQSADYYKEQKKILQGFGLHQKDVSDPENNYFKFMIMRDLRAIEYAKSLPEWNGKDLNVGGGSMGGFQSLFIAALDKDVTKCTVNVPWMCNLNRVGEGKQKSLFQPVNMPTGLYFDSTYAVKRLKCPLKITARLGDYVCPPAGITILYNNSKVPTELEFAQNGTHGYTTPWKNNPVYKKNK